MVLAELEASPRELKHAIALTKRLSHNFIYVAELEAPPLELKHAMALTKRLSLS